MTRLSAAAETSSARPCSARKSSKQEPPCWFILCPSLVRLHRSLSCIRSFTTMIEVIPNVCAALNIAGNASSVAPTSKTTRIREPTGSGHLFVKTLLYTLRPASVGGATGFGCPLHEKPAQTLARSQAARHEMTTTAQPTTRNRNKNLRPLSVNTAVGGKLILQSELRSSSSDNLSREISLDTTRMAMKVAGSAKMSTVIGMKTRSMSNPFG